MRDEIKRGTALGRNGDHDKGQLLPDAMILDILKNRVQKGVENGERGFLLDGFPRTVHQAEQLRTFAEVTQVMNLGLREEISSRSAARVAQAECGKNFNIADINYPATCPTMPSESPAGARKDGAAQGRYRGGGPGEASGVQG